MKENLNVLYDELNVIYKFCLELPNTDGNKDNQVRADLISYIMKRMCNLFPDEILPF